MISLSHVERHVRRAADDRGVAADRRATCVLMGAVCTLACLVPTRRALRVHPVEALREKVTPAGAVG